MVLPCLLRHCQPKGQFSEREAAAALIDTVLEDRQVSEEQLNQELYQQLGRLTRDVANLLTAFKFE